MIPNASVWIGDEVLDASRWRVLTLDRSESKHDLLTIETTMEPTGSSFSRGAPVQMAWGTGTGMQSQFYGYVANVNPVHTRYGGGPNNVSGRIGVLGATAALNTVAPETWSNRNIPSVIAEVVQRKRFNLIADNHSYVWPVLLRTGETDWEWVVKLANQIGYRLVSDGMQLRLYDPKRVAEVPGNVVALVGGGQPGATLSHFSVQFNNTDDANREWFGFSANDHGDVSRYESAPADPVLGALATDRSRLGMAQVPTSDYTTVRSYAEAHKRRNFWTVQASLEGSGNPDIRPGNLVTVSAPGVEYSGFWAVLSARHTITGSGITVEASVGKDAVLDRPVTARRTVRPAPVTMIGKRWVAAWSNA